jgi:hypothetical protein
VRKVIHRNGISAVFVLAGLLAAQGTAQADSPSRQSTSAADAAAAPDPLAVDPAGGDDAPRHATDELLELVVDYLDLAFVPEPKASRTASLETGRHPEAIAQ